MVATTKVYLFVCFLILVIGVYFQRDPREDYDYFQGVSWEAYDYFLLALQWPPSFCNTTGRENKCREDVMQFSNFTIHGLWPQKNGRGIKCTYGPDFDPEELKRDENLTKLMEKYWPNLIRTRTDYEFWEHEWKDHGRCIGWDQNNYFNRTVDVYITENISSLVEEFGKHGIHKGESYTIGNYTEAIQKTSLHVIPRSFQDNVSSINRTQLLEIRLCVEKTGTNLMNCPLLAFPEWPDEIS